MKNKTLAYTLLIILTSFILYFLYPSSEKNTEENTATSLEAFDFLPTSTTGAIIKHNYYTLSYNEAFEQAEWVAYELKATHLSNTNRNRPLFELDDKIKTKSAHWNNFKNSGYSKGHLCPAGDRKFSEKAYNETFLTSNVSPQQNDFNAGVWNRLEQKVRYWASKEKHLYIITGGVLEKNLKTIGNEKVAVPKYFYKILLDYSNPQIKAIAFLIPHKNSEKPLYTFVTSIDELEALTNIDFFPALPDTIENELEASSNYKNWSF
ncbi:MAG: DNA/RNA non-specific endonuclease [Flavobacteriaceae bacterium]